MGRYKYFLRNDAIPQRPRARLLARDWVIREPVEGSTGHAQTPKIPVPRGLDIWGVPSGGQGVLAWDALPPKPPISRARYPLELAVGTNPDTHVRDVGRRSGSLWDIPNLFWVSRSPLNWIPSCCGRSGFTTSTSNYRN